MTKTRIMNAIKCVFALVLFVGVGLYSISCSCNEMEGQQVYKNFEEFINDSDNIFKFEENKVVLDIPYNNDVKLRLNDELTYYNTATESNGKYSDFYIIKAVYEPMLEVAIYQVATNYLSLKNDSDKLDKEQVNNVNEKLKTLKSTSSALMNSITVLNNHSSSFSQQLTSAEPGYEFYKYEYRITNRNVYSELKNLKKNFENVISACFDLNNTFMDMYLSTRPSYDFSAVSAADFTNTTTNQTIIAVLDDYLNYMVTMLAYTAFSIDGGQCSFLTTTETFAIMYAQIDNAHFADRYKYDEHLAQIKGIINKKSLFNFYDGVNDNLKDSYLAHVVACQYRYNEFMQQVGYFKEALNGVNYKNYIMSDMYAEIKAGDKTYLDYALTLQADERSKFIVVQQFLDDYFTPLAQSVAALQAEIENV